MAASRIELVSDKKAGPIARFSFWLAKKKVGKVPGSLRLFAHNTRVLFAYGSFETWMGGAKRVDVKIKTLASLRVAQLVGCPF